MCCPSCESGRQAEFRAEINIHFRGLKNLDKPGVLVFPKVVVCLNCGSSLFIIPETELALLAGRCSKELSLKPGEEGRRCSTPPQD